MSRCKACDCKLKDIEMYELTNEDDEHYDANDMCWNCIGKSFYEYEYAVDKEYRHGSLGGYFSNETDDFKRFVDSL